jgi:hypothetical protein
MREREFAFGRDSLVPFGQAFDAVARVTRLALRGGNEMTNFIGARRGRSKHSRFELDELADSELMSHEAFLSSY